MIETMKVHIKRNPVTMNFEGTVSGDNETLVVPFSHPDLFKQKMKEKLMKNGFSEKQAKRHVGLSSNFIG